jgi:putative peptidoglycan lipid II flippase
MPPDVAHDTGQPSRSASGRLARSAGLAGIATLTSRILGLVRETVFATVFGAGNEMDAFNVAFRVPNLTRDLFAEGAMSAAFVPAFTRHLTTDGKASAWRLGNSMLNTLLLITAILVVLGVVFARPIVEAFAPGYAAVPGKLELTVQLTRIMLPFLTLVAIAAVVMGMLNALHHYFVPSVAPAAFNVASIVCAVALTPLMPGFGLPGIAALAIAALLGGVGQVAAQWPALAGEGFRYRPRIDWSDPHLHRVLMLMVPGTLGLAATQINLFVATQLATSQGTGAVSWLSYAFRLMYLPIGLFGVSIATAVLPQAARHAAANDRRAIRDTVSQGLSLMLMVNLPAMVGLIVLATPIVRLLFEHGRFTATDTAATAAALRLYALGLIGYSAVRILSPVFYALGRNRVPVIVSVATVIVNVILSLILVRLLGFRGLALSTSIAAVFNAGLLLVFLRQRLDRFGGRELAGTFVAVMLAAGAMAIVTAAVDRWSHALIPGAGALAQAIRLVASIAAGLATLGLAARLLRIRAFDEAVTIVKPSVQKLLRR